MTEVKKRFGIDYENTIEANRELWAIHEWHADGDEWDGQARVLGVPYAEWKKALVDEFIVPYVAADMTVLEIAAGRGRWSELLLPRCRKLILVDLSPECVEYCRKKFQSWPNIDYIVTDGQSLPGARDNNVNFVWSFDSFVHMEPEHIASYMREMARVLVPGGRACIHHAGRANAWLWLGGVRSHAKWLRRLYALLSMGVIKDDDGWRSNMSGELFRRLAEDAGLKVVAQQRFWGPDNRYGVPRYRDLVTTLIKPS